MNRLYHCYFCSFHWSVLNPIGELRPDNECSGLHCPRCDLKQKNIREDEYEKESLKQRLYACVSEGHRQMIMEYIETNYKKKPHADDKFFKRQAENLNCGAYNLLAKRINHQLGKTTYSGQPVDIYSI